MRKGGRVGERKAKEGERERERLKAESAVVRINCYNIAGRILFGRVYM